MYQKRNYDRKGAPTGRAREEVADDFHATNEKFRRPGFRTVFTLYHFSPPARNYHLFILPFLRRYRIYRFNIFTAIRFYCFRFSSVRVSSALPGLPFHHFSCPPDLPVYIPHHSAPTPAYYFTTLSPLRGYQFSP